MKLKVTACLLAGLSLCGCALQKDYVAVQGRLTLLEEELGQSRALAQGMENTVTSQNARLANKLEKFEEDLRSIRGDLEASLHHSTELTTQTTDVDQSLEQMRLSVEALSKRLSRLEAFTGYEPSAPHAPAKPANHTTAQSAYLKAKKAFDDGDMESAKKGFSAVVETFAASDSADNAQFWIGEIYYREKWYQKAILEYQKVIENYPDGNKVPAAYLKQGLAFEALGETENAHLILGELLRKHPDTAEASIARKKMKK